MNDYFIKEVDFDNDWYSLSKESFDVTPTFDEFKENLTQANARNFGFFLNEKMIGTFTLSQNLDNVLSKCYEINNVSIDSKLRNNGLGKIMFNSLFNLFNDCNFCLFPLRSPDCPAPIEELGFNNLSPADATDDASGIYSSPTELNKLANYVSVLSSEVLIYSKVFTALVPVIGVSILSPTIPILTGCSLPSLNSTTGFE